MIILGIETSCDETAAAVVEDGTKVLSNVVASSIEFHQKTGGIIPEVAAREQLRCIIPVVDAAVQSACLAGRRAKDKVQSLDAIAVTVGPGLIGSLLIGVETAKALSFVWKKPLIPINHLQAHLYANWLTPEKESKRVHSESSLRGVEEQEFPKFPAIGLVVSGGHTDLILMKNHSQIKWLGGTRDDAAGECFDKCARLLELGYPGGPAISKAADEWLKSNSQLVIPLPRPMINDKTLDFSFSGLKTAVLTVVKSLKEKKEFNKEKVIALAYEIQEAITDVLVKKTLKAVSQYQVNSLILAGGVTANPRLREKFKLSIINYQLSIPEPKFCTDNAVFVASCAFFNFKPIPWQKIQADSSLEIEEVIKF